ncbi:hypothetical protein Patl1_07362 [Pistacia atlantica]|uniref:Uncharacterized protein n=1 Tax=Pistacia atlantica TaxID=434234 RepID=A0ACC1AK19_9ROSI|nr:hypothetical protein Patl1_07362 [Pistacia atlantica]
MVISRQILSALPSPCFIRHIPFTGTSLQPFYTLCLLHILFVYLGSYLTGEFYTLFSLFPLLYYFKLPHKELRFIISSVPIFNLSAAVAACHLIHLLEENCTMPFWLCSVFRDVLNHAFIDVERDLTERETPMDCLIFGDVGFGKTEVALRAIFCVVSAGKQAMVLAPTIVLAKQHFDVISERFSIYPNVNVGLLSQFQTKAEKEEYLDMIKQGHLNIIVGTHSLLGSRVVFNSLGLLVVDEEQRFGVKQKEKIAPFKTSVDVLTLKEKVISAVKNELDRDGQVFYVLPRIKGLEEVMDFLEQAFPNVEIAIAHGQVFPPLNLHMHVFYIK